MKEKLNITINTNNTKEEYKVLGSINNRKIEYYETNNLRSKIVIDIDKHILIKDNIDYKITLNLDKKKETKAIILLKKESKELELTLKTEEFSFKDDTLSMRYTIIESKEEISYLINIGGKYEYN